MTLHRDLIPDSSLSTKGLTRMPGGRHNLGPLWVDGSIVVRARDRKQRSWRLVKIRRPHAVIGRHPHADLVIDRPQVADHHVFLFLDARGLFGVDLRTDSGTRFAGTEAEAAWLGSGDLIEVGDQTIEILQLRVNGTVLTGPLADDDPLGLVAATAGTLRHDLTLRHRDDPNANWSIGSSLVFLGRGPACAVQLADPAVGLTHSAILRDGPTVYLVPFPGAAARVNDRVTPAATRLADADVVAIGADTLLVATHEIAPTGPAASFENLVTRLEMAVGPEHFGDVGFTFEAHQAQPPPPGGPIDYPALIGRLQAETAALVAVLLRRIEALDEEMAALRDRLDADERARTPEPRAPVEKLRWDLIPPAEIEAAPPGEAGVWLVERLQELETERRTTWSNLLNRLTSGRATD